MKAEWVIIIGAVVVIIPFFLIWILDIDYYDARDICRWWKRRLWTKPLKFLASTFRELRDIRRLRRKCKKIIKRQWYKATGRKALMKKQVIKLGLRKREMETELSIWAAPEIEEFFRTASLQKDNPRRNDDGGNADGNTSTSKKWKDANGKGLTYYVKNEKLRNKLEGMNNVIDNFGNGLYHRGQLNLALLRVKGISEGDGVVIRTSDLLGFEEMNQYAQELASWTKAFYEEYLHEQDLEASITLEM